MHGAHLGAAVGGRLHAEVQRLVRRVVADGLGDLLIDRDAAAPARQRAVAADLVARVERAPGEERHALLVRLARAAGRAPRGRAR